MRPVRASEIGEFVYCHHAWWLHHVQGLESAHVTEMAAGVADHAAHGRLVTWGRRAQLVAIILVLVAVVLALWR